LQESNLLLSQNINTARINYSLSIFYDGEFVVL